MRSPDPPLAGRGPARGLGLLDAVLGLGLLALGLLAFSRLQAGLRETGAGLRTQALEAGRVLDRLEAWRPLREPPNWADDLGPEEASRTRWFLEDDPTLRGVWMQAAPSPGGPAPAFATLVQRGSPEEAAWRLGPGASVGAGGGLGRAWRAPPAQAGVQALGTDLAAGGPVRWAVAGGPLLQVDAETGRLEALCSASTSPAPPRCEPSPGWLFAGHVLDDGATASHQALASWTGWRLEDDAGSLRPEAACTLGPHGPGPGRLGHRAFLCWLPTRPPGGAWTGRPSPQPTLSAGLPALRLCAWPEGLAASFIPARGRYEAVAASLRGQRFQVHAGPTCPPGQWPVPP